MKNNKLHNFYSVAPMMGRTDAFFCYLMYLINRDVTVYSEMMHSELINRSNILDTYDIITNKKKVIIQIAGSAPLSLAKACKKIKEKGFSEINLNCGCPSPRVQSGKFGIILLTKPKLVSECINTIKKSVDIMISVKTRIGINKYNNNLIDIFLRELNSINVKKIIIHARKALLKNISAKKNLNIPELNYDRVLKIKEKFKNNTIIINGGFEDTKNDKKLLESIDGIMIGRSAYKNPWIFADNNNIALQEKKKVINLYLNFLDKYFKNFKFSHSSVLHLQNIFNGYEGSKAWKKEINRSIKNKNLACLFEYLKYNMY